MITEILASGAAKLENLESQVEAIGAALGSTYNVAPSVKEAEYLKSYETDIFNEELKTAKAAYTDIVSEALSTMSTLKTWISLLVPKVQDGGNFGVGIQMQLIKMLTESYEKQSALLELPAAFHEKRSQLVDKAVNKETNEAKTSEVVEAIEKDKTGKSVTKSVTVVTAKPHKELLQSLAAIDSKLYAQMKLGLMNLQGILTVTLDFAQKNKDKLQNPRGTVNNSSYMY